MRTGVGHDGGSWVGGWVVGCAVPKAVCGAQVGGGMAGWGRVDVASMLASRCCSCSFLSVSVGVSSGENRSGSDCAESSKKPAHASLTIDKRGRDRSGQGNSGPFEASQPAIILGAHKFEVELLQASYSPDRSGLLQFAEQRIAYAGSEEQVASTVPESSRVAVVPIVELTKGTGREPGSMRLQAQTSASSGL